MAYTVTQSAPVSGSLTQFRIPMPAKQAGDYIQFIIIAASAPTEGFSASELAFSIDGTVYVYQKSVSQTSGATNTSNGLLVKYATSTPYKAWSQVLHADPLNPSLPTLTATVVEGDQQLTVNWDTDTPNGFASFLVTLGGATPQTSGTLPGTARTALFQGLTNGTTYPVTVEGTTA